jgi:glycosyltransferase involved in cell wall biosynthesis
MKIAHLWYVLPLYGGAETWALGLSKALRKIGIESEIVCWATDSATVNKEYVRVLEEDISDSPDLVDIMMNGAFMAKHLQEYDLICSHHPDVLFPAVFAKSLNGSQIASILHEPPIEWKHSGDGIASYRYLSDKSEHLHTIWKMFMPYSDLFFTNSEWNRRLYEKYEGISPIPLLGGVDSEVFKPDKKLRQEYRDKLHVDQDTVLLFYASSAGRRKRHEILLRSLRILIQKGYRVKCILTCSKDRRTPSFHPLVNRIIKELGLESEVFSFPAVNDESLVGLYNACDIYTHPANNEHLGMAILEAMACGKPVVAQRNGGVPELIDDNVNGLCFKTDSVDNMAFCVERLIGKSDLRAEFGKNALEKSKSFDWLQVAKKFRDVVS